MPADIPMTGASLRGRVVMLGFIVLTVVLWLKAFLLRASPP
jgi:hypothetical protein